MKTKHKIKPAQGGKREGSGRKPLSPDFNTIVITARLTEGQKHIFDNVGGITWLRYTLDKIAKP